MSYNENLIEDLINEFLWAMNCEKRYSINTYKTYQYDFNVFTEFLNESGIEIKSENLFQSYDAFLRKKKVNSSTILRKINLLINFMNYCKEEKGMNLDIPEKNKIKINKSYRPFLENLDLQKIRESICENTKKNVRLSFITEVLYSTGMRVSELLGLLMSDFDIIKEKKSLIIKGKGGAKRVIFFSDRAICAIETYISYYSPKGLLLDMTRQRVFQLLKELGMKLNIDLSKIFPHSFRHRMLTNLVKNGLDLVSVQKIAGHKQISTTEKYTHVEDYLYEEIATFHPLFKF